MVIFALFIALVFCVAAAYDNFYFYTSILCSFDDKPSYSYDIRFYEDNGWDSKDAVNISDWTKGNNLTAKGITNATFFAQEDPDKSNGYHFFAYIIHDCLLTGGPEGIEVWFMKNYCQKSKGDCHIYANIDLTGLVRRCYSKEYRDVTVKQG